jgi:hypothetical protein
MHRKRPDPLLVIILFVGIGLIITTVSKELRPPGIASVAPLQPASQLLADDDARAAR